jgi:hypothetical protein
VALVRVAAEGVPKFGAVRVGLVANTAEPVPVSSVRAARKLAEDGVPKKVATPVPKPLTPVEIGSPVALVKVAADGVPRFGVVRVGLVANTAEPLPVSSVRAAAKLAEDGVPKKVATPEPKEVIPVPPLATGSVPVTPVVRGSPVALVRVAAEGVPRSGVVRAGLVANTAAPLPVSSVKAAAKLAEDGVPKKVATPAPRPLTPVEIGNPVALVRVPALGVPMSGVVRVGLEERTTEPVPVDEVTPVPPLATGRVPVI